MNAYIQSSLEKREAHSSGVSSLKAVVSFLYCFQIVVFSVAGTLMGVIVDRSNDFEQSMKVTAGVQFTVIAGMSLVATFVPKGAFAINPKAIGISLEMEQKQDEENQGAAQDEDGDKEEDLRRSIGSPVMLDLDTIPRAMPATAR